MNKKDLDNFKKLLTNDKEKIIESIHNTTKELSELRDSGASDEFDVASINTDQIISQAINEQQAKNLGEINWALSKIDNGKYGICEMCDDEISIERLKIKPHARFCIVCSEMLEKMPKRKG